MFIAIATNDINGIVNRFTRHRFSHRHGVFFDFLRQEAPNGCEKDADTRSMY